MTVLSYPYVLKVGVFACCITQFIMPYFFTLLSYIVLK